MPTESIIITNAILFFLMLDPIGNLPLFIAHLKQCDSREYIRIVIRESLIALMFMLATLSIGKYVIAMMKLSTSSIGIAGGVILMILALKMVFASLSLPESLEKTPSRKPFIVPLALPLICGPGTISMLLLMRTTANGSLHENTIALCLAWIPQTLILLSGRIASKYCGEKLLDALESLMGLLLACLSIEMLITGIKTAFNLQ